MAYLKHWNLKEKPFEELCDVRFFYESVDHREALDRLLYVANDSNMNMGLLTGEIGSGKTITKNVFLNALPRQKFEVVSFDNSSFSFNDILYDIVESIAYRDPRLSLMEQIDFTRNDKYALTQAFKKKLETLTYTEKRHLIIIFDEAQQMHSQVLDEIKNLTNIGSRTENLMTVFIIGQPELRSIIKKLPQVDQRVFLRFHLKHLDYTETVKYTEHRLRIAGNEKKCMFDGSAFKLIFSSTDGVPRVINRLCKLSLHYGFAQNRDVISEEDVQDILDDMQEQLR
ncbi:AAA family ATPase [Chitinispirillales bacterium ANBcel5]|uniref:ExeA family protein n=1 Tax=Cellulosispirillum alkaliphilum TaxID=3039283 RepID=UPI002A4ED426|nr:AAA family ATPase [Chitinispirillales bacterium ANBcel5]